MHARYEDNLKVLEMLGEDMNKIWNNNIPEFSESEFGLAETMKMLYKGQDEKTLRGWYNISGLGFRMMEVIIKGQFKPELEEKLKSSISDFKEILYGVMHSSKRREMGIDPKYIERYEKLMDRPAYVDEDRIKKAEESEAAKVAARWWRDAIDRPRLDNGDKSQAGEMATMLATDESNNKLDIFQTAFEGRIKEEFITRDWVSLFVNNGLDGILAESAIEAEVSGNNFPCYTGMSVKMDEVRVSAGYGAESKIIYMTQECAARHIERLKECAATKSNLVDIEHYAGILEKGGYNMYSQTENAIEYDEE